jgi:hypothetical protein
MLILEYMALGFRSIFKGIDFLNGQHRCIQSLVSIKKVAETPSELLELII